MNSWEQRSNAENEMMRKIHEIGRLMDMIQVTPIDFLALPTEVKTDEETVCEMIDNVYQSRKNLTNENGFDMAGRKRIEEALKKMLVEKNRAIALEFNVCDKLVQWLVCYPEEFCHGIVSSARLELKFLLDAPGKLKEMISPEEQKLMIEKLNIEILRKKAKIFELLKNK